MAMMMDCDDNDEPCYDYFGISDSLLNHLSTSSNRRQNDDEDQPSTRKSHHPPKEEESSRTAIIEYCNCVVVISPLSSNSGVLNHQSSSPQAASAASKPPPSKRQRTTQCHSCGRPLLPATKPATLEITTTAHFENRVSRLTRKVSDIMMDPNDNGKNFAPPLYYQQSKKARIW